jgi:hypothetical protein
MTILFMMWAVNRKRAPRPRGTSIATASGNDRRMDPVLAPTPDPSDVPFRFHDVPVSMNANSRAARGRNVRGIPVRYA